MGCCCVYVPTHALSSLTTLFYHQVLQLDSLLTWEQNVAEKPDPAQLSVIHFIKGMNNSLLMVFIFPSGNCYFPNLFQWVDLTSTSLNVVPSSYGKSGICIQKHHLLSTPFSAILHALLPMIFSYCQSHCMVLVAGLQMEYSRVGADGDCEGNVYIQNVLSLVKKKPSLHLHHQSLCF